MDEKTLTPFEQGFRAYQSGKGQSENPYKHPPEGTPDTHPYWQWWNGWRKADREDND